jgi:hypothetical protein
MDTIKYQNGSIAWNGSNALHQNGSIAWNGTQAFYQNGMVAWDGTRAFYINGKPAWDGSNAYYSNGNSMGTDGIEIILGEALKMRAGKNGFSLFVYSNRIV